MIGLIIIGSYYYLGFGGDVNLDVRFLIDVGDLY